MSKWTGKTRGSLLGYRIITWFIRFTGLRVTYFILRFVSFYFFAFSKSSREHLFKFYNEQMAYSKMESNALLRENFFLLAQSLVDRIAVALGKGGQITFTENGEAWLRQMATSKSGGFLISAHLSNWDIASHFLSDVNTKINVVMLENEHENIKRFLGKMSSQAKFEVIAQKTDMSHIFLIYQAIKRGELVCMHADRFVENASTYEQMFFNKKAHFPAGPFQLIQKLNVPYSFVFATKSSRFKYHFTATEPKLVETSAEQVASEFVRLLEQKVKDHPSQWFNYHNFYLTP